MVEVRHRKVCSQHQDGRHASRCGVWALARLAKQGGRLSGRPCISSEDAGGTKNESSGSQWQWWSKLGQQGDGPPLPTITTNDNRVHITPHLRRRRRHHRLAARLQERRAGARPKRAERDERPRGFWPARQIQALQDATHAARAAAAAAVRKEGCMERHKPCHRDDGKRRLLHHGERQGIKARRVEPEAHNGKAARDNREGEGRAGGWCLVGRLVRWVVPGHNREAAHDAGTRGVFR
eukprot:45131-Chlamydomonas_euryale.AAC.2